MLSGRCFVVCSPEPKRVSDFDHLFDEGGGIGEHAATINFQAATGAERKRGVDIRHTGARRIVGNNQPRLALVVRNRESGDEVRDTEVKNIGVTTSKIIR